MKSKYLIIIIILISQLAYSQKDIEQNFILSIGQGFEDGLISVSNIPTIGIRYEVGIFKYLSIETNLFSYYRNYADSYLISNQKGEPVLDIIVEESFGPFATPEEIEKIKNTGIKDIDFENVIKLFSIPITIGLKLYPFNYKNHKIGFMAGLGIGYYSYNWPKDFFAINKIVLQDGTVYENLYLSQDTEFRNISPLEHFAISYSYTFNDVTLGIQFNEMSRFIGWQHHFFESSFFFKFKL